MLVASYYKIVMRMTPANFQGWMALEKGLFHSQILINKPESLLGLASVNFRNNPITKIASCLQLSHSRVLGNIPGSIRELCCAVGGKQLNVTQRDD